MQQTRFEYTHHLPYGVRSNLCNLLDADQSWRSLGAKHGLDGTQLNLLGQAYMRANGSPTNELLNRLDSLNVPIRQLCRSLSELNHWQAVELLQPYDNYQQVTPSMSATNGKRATLEQLANNNNNNMAPQPTGAPENATEGLTLVTPTPSFANVNVDCYMQSLNSDNMTSSAWILREDESDGVKQVDCNATPQATIDTDHQQEAAAAAAVARKPPVVQCHKELERQQLNQMQNYQKQQLYFNSSQTNNKKLKDNLEEDKIRRACATNRPRTSLTDSDVVNQLRLIMQINYKELKVASDNFNELNIIGNGGFASVYRGNLKGTEVAIKRLKCNLVDQALNELTIMNSYRIDNILPIYGISVDGPEACLVYQYMSNGSLEDRLMCKNNSAPLTWKQRALIGEGIAKSLYYLHTLRDKPLVHGDVKSANVLLDSQFVPKLGDFGLARQVFKGIKGKEMLTHCTVSSINGTSVYLPAEYLRHRILSPAVDVYSYGIVLLEMGTGKRAYDGKRLLIDRVEDETSSISSGQIDLTLKDHRLDDNTQIGLKIWFELMIKLGLQCAHRIKKKRPDMGQVLSRYSTFWNENSQAINELNKSSSIASNSPTSAASSSPQSSSTPSPKVITTILPNHHQQQQYQQHHYQPRTNGNEISNNDKQQDNNNFQESLANHNNINNNLQNGNTNVQFEGHNQLINANVHQLAQHNNSHNNNAQLQQQQIFFNDTNCQQQVIGVHQQNNPNFAQFNPDNQVIGVIAQNFDNNNAQQQLQPQQILFAPQEFNQQEQQHQQFHMTHNQPNENMINNRPYVQNYAQPVGENYACSQNQAPPINNQQQFIIQQQPYLQFNSSNMQVEQQVNHLLNKVNQHPSPQQQQQILQQNDTSIQQHANTLVLNNNTDDKQTHQMQQDSNQVEAMIPLLTELGIEGDQSDRD